jgi:hypothetical protein
MDQHFFQMKPEYLTQAETLEKISETMPDFWNEVAV